MLQRCSVEAVGRTEKGSFLNAIGDFLAALMRQAEIQLSDGVKEAKARTDHVLNFRLEHGRFCPVPRARR
jgi:hypothetical protein